MNDLIFFLFKQHPRKVFEEPRLSGYFSPSNLGSFLLNNLLTSNRQDKNNIV